MMPQQTYLYVFEHDILRCDGGREGLKRPQLDALVAYHGTGTPFFSLVHNGIKFCEYVGVLRVGILTIHVLPKVDKRPPEDWQAILLDMLKAVGTFRIHSTGQAALMLRSNSILDLYFELFVNEVNYLLHKGLVRKYRRTEGNATALKGSLKFEKHLRQNATHQERFYVGYTTYDSQHLLNQILYKTLRLLKRLNTKSDLTSRIGALLLNFPEMPDVSVSEPTFEKILYNRKTEDYKPAIEIARLLLLAYHPDFTNGRQDVLALLFDMNLLWERYVFTRLKRKLGPEHQLIAQGSKNFWRSSSRTLRLRPDIVINPGKPNCIVLDTKWKVLNQQQLSMEDIRQMYAYAKYFQATRVALLYPSSQNFYKVGRFEKIQADAPAEECGLMGLSYDFLKSNEGVELEELFGEYLAKGGIELVNDF